MSAATEMIEPGLFVGQLRPDPMWPDDRRWFVRTDVDFWAMYVGGDRRFVSELQRHVATPTELVDLGDHLVAEP